jgi:hypothetical protein
MVDDLNSTRAKPLTFFDAMSLTWLAFSLAWRILGASVAGWWSGGAIGSIRAMPRQKGSADIDSERLEVTFQTITVTVTVTPRVT